MSEVTAPATSPHGASPVDSHDHHQSSMTSWARLRWMVRPDRGDVLAVVAFAVAIGVMLLATPVAVQALVNFVALGGVIPPLIVVAGMLFLGLGFAGVLTALQTWTVELLQRRLFVRTVADLAERLPRVRRETWDNREGHEVVNRFLDVVTIQKVGSFLLLDGLSILLSVLVGLVVLAFYHPLLFAFDVVLLVVIGALVFGPLRRGASTAVDESKAKYSMVSWLQEVARHPTAFKAGGAEGWALARADVLAGRWVVKRRLHYRVVFGQVLGALALQTTANVALLGIGGFLVMDGALTLGQLVAAELIVTLVVSSVAKLGKHLESFYDLMAAVDKVGQMFDLPLESEGAGRGLPSREGPLGVTLSHVSWAPPRRGPVLQGLDLEIAPGEALGVKGSSGSGKSVLLELLWGMRQPSEGFVSIDGVDLRELSPHALRSDVAMVDSTVEIVSGSIRDNVRLGRAHVTEADVADALDRVGLTERLGHMPEGLETGLGPGGRPLTGGDVRRVLLARALAGSPRLLLVQDLVDHVDDDLRTELLDVLTAPDRGFTLVIVSHRADVLARCDRHLDLDEDRRPAGSADDPEATP